MCVGVDIDYLAVTAHAKCLRLVLVPESFSGKVFMSHGVRRASSTRYFRTFQFFECWGSGRGRAAHPALGHKVFRALFDCF